MHYTFAASLLLFGVLLLLVVRICVLLVCLRCGRLVVLFGYAICLVLLVIVVSYCGLLCIVGFWLGIWCCLLCWFCIGCFEDLLLVMFNSVVVGKLLMGL